MLEVDQCSLDFLKMEIKPLKTFGFCYYNFIDFLFEKIVYLSTLSLKESLLFPYRIDAPGPKSVILSSVDHQSLEIF